MNNNFVPANMSVEFKSGTVTMTADRRRVSVHSSNTAVSATEHYQQQALLRIMESIGKGFQKETYSVKVEIPTMLGFFANSDDMIAVSEVCKAISEQNVYGIEAVVVRAKRANIFTHVNTIVVECYGL